MNFRRSEGAGRRALSTAVGRDPETDGLHHRGPGRRGEPRAMIMIYIFEENHRFSKQTPHPTPRRRCRPPTLTASSRRSRSDFRSFAISSFEQHKEVQMADLYVFHQGFRNSGRLWYSVFDGTSWAADAAFIYPDGAPAVGITAAPSAVATERYIIVSHQGFGNNGQLWFSYSTDGANWYGD